LGARPIKPPKSGTKHKEKFSKHGGYVNKITKEYPHYDAVQKAMRIAPFIFNSHNQVEGSRPVFLKRNYRVQRTYILETFASMIHNHVQKTRGQRLEEENKRVKARNNSNYFLHHVDIESLIRKGSVCFEADPSQTPTTKKRNT